MIDVKVPDIAEIQRNLAELSEILQTQAIRSGLTRAVSPIKKSMALNAPKNKGNLSKSITQNVIGKKQASQLSPADRRQLISAESGVAIVVGPNKKVKGRSQAYKGLWLEEGTKRHVIKPKPTNKTGLLKFFGGGGLILAKRIDHPGVKATNFMQDALTANSSQMQTRFYQGLAARLNKIKSK